MNASPRTKTEGISDTADRLANRTKDLAQNFANHYNQIQQSVKESIEGPVKRFYIRDENQLVLQLSFWDVKQGPTHVMTAGNETIAKKILHGEYNDTNRLMDLLEDGETCDLSKNAMARILLKLHIPHLNIRGDAGAFLIAVYYPEDVNIPKKEIEELLKEMSSILAGMPDLVEEAMQMQLVFNAATSRWKDVLLRLRDSIWNLVKKAPAYSKDDKKPAISSEKEENIKKIENSKVKDGKKKGKNHKNADTIDEKPDKIDESFMETVLEQVHNKEHEPEFKGQEKTSNKIPSTPIGKNDEKPTNPEPRVAEFLAKLEMLGFQIKLDKENETGTALRLIQRGKKDIGGKIALILSFRTKILDHSRIDVLGDKFYEQEADIDIQPYRPPVRDVLDCHLADAREILVGGDLIGYSRDGLILRPVVLPIIPVHGSIFDEEKLVPYTWIPPKPVNDDNTGEKTIKWGFYLFSRNALEGLESFLMDVLRATGTKMVKNEVLHVQDAIKQGARIDTLTRISIPGVIIPAILVLLACARLFPLGVNLMFLQYSFIPLTIAGLIIGYWQYSSHQLKQNVGEILHQKQSAYSKAVPLLLKITNDDIIPVAKRLGKERFSRFKHDFCTYLDATVVEETASMVFAPPIDSQLSQVVSPSLPRNKNHVEKHVSYSSTANQLRKIVQESSTLVSQEATWEKDNTLAPKMQSQPPSHPIERKELKTTAELEDEDLLPEVVDPLAELS